MAHLLGSRNCLESLSKDVCDLHEAIQSILQKVGRVDFVSWKFPGKDSSRLNIAEMIDDYSFCKDEESNRLSHIIMFELVIDRFCLLLQVVSKLFDQMRCSDDSDERRPASKTVTTTMSIGLVCKTFWSRLSQFQYGYQNLTKEVSDYNQSLMNMEKLVTEIKDENRRLRQQSSRKPKLAINFDNSPTPQTELSLTENHNQENHSISTQTFETAFVDCDACASLQEHLLEVGRCVVDICETQSLPSATNKQNKIIRTTKLSCSNVNKWSTELQRDLRKIDCLISEKISESDDFKYENSRLKERITTKETGYLKLQEDFKTLTGKEQNLTSECFTLKELLGEREGEMQTCKHRLTEESIKLEEAKRRIDELTNQLSMANQDIEKHKTSAIALEQGMNSISLQLQSTQNSQATTKRTEEDLQETRQKLTRYENDLKLANEELTKLRSEKKVLLKHDQTLQTKHSKLLGRVETMDDQCEELQSQLSEVLEEKQQLHESNESLKNKIINYEDEIGRNKSRQNGQLTDQREVTRYEQQLDEIKRKLHLVVCYPVMGDGYETAQEDYKRLLNQRHLYDNGDNDDDDVVLDMERQLKANTTRITILEKQNKSLRGTLMKLDGRTEQKQHYGEAEDNQQREERFHNSYPDNRTTKSAPQRSTQQQPRPPSSPKSRHQNTRPRSGGRRNENSIQSRLADLEKLKKNSMMNGSTAGESNNGSVSASLNENQKTVQDSRTIQFQCPDCDKEHISQRDLEIHRPFCFGRL